MYPAERANVLSRWLGLSTIGSAARPLNLGVYAEKLFSSHRGPQVREVPPGTDVSKVSTHAPFGMPELLYVHRLVAHPYLLTPKLEEQRWLCRQRKQGRATHVRAAVYARPNDAVRQLSPLRPKRCAWKGGDHYVGKHLRWHAESPMLAE